MCFPGVHLFRGEVDYLIDDYDSLSAVPIELKSGKGYTIPSAPNAFVKAARAFGSTRLMDTSMREGNWSCASCGSIK